MTALACACFATLRSIPLFERLIAAVPFASMTIHPYPPHQQSHEDVGRLCRQKNLTFITLAGDEASVRQGFETMRAAEAARSPLALIMDKAGHDYCVTNAERYSPRRVRLIVAVGHPSDFPHIDCLVCSGGKRQFLPDFEVPGETLATTANHIGAVTNRLWGVM